VERRFTIGKLDASIRTIVVAELSANHHQQFEEAVALVRAAAASGADAVKLQTYTPDTLTIDCDSELFRIRTGTIWDGQTLHGLFEEAYTPWEWQPTLKSLAEELGMECFSSPFDESAVNFLEAMNVPAYKVASLEIVDLPLIERIARTGKPMIMSTGAATLGEIDDAVRAARSAGARELALLKCTMAYPAPADEANLSTIAHLSQSFDVSVGLSDHTIGIAVPVAAVALGACIIEKHFTLSRAKPGPDSAFSLEPSEFRAMVDAIRTTESAIGQVRYGSGESETACRPYRRSLFVTANVEPGEAFTPQNVRSIRPGNGLAPKHLPAILGRRAARAVAKGTPLSWDLLAPESSRP
jgi:pseudaminic acid synthase